MELVNADFSRPKGTQRSAVRLRDSSGSLTEPKLRLMMENIAHSNSQTLAFVQELLTNASFGQGLTITTEFTSLSESLARAGGQYQEAARRKQLALEMVLPAQNAVLQADPAPLSRVLGNLLSCCLRFSLRLLALPKLCVGIEANRANRKTHGN
jgi:signal transduction histidine kinase